MVCSLFASIDKRWRRHYGRQRMAIGCGQSNTASTPGTATPLLQQIIAKPPAACGVVESMRKIERQGDVGGQYIADIKVSRGVTGGASGTAIAANAVTGTGYEITVRFRDGSTAVLNEASLRTWPLGSRGMAIGRSNASSN
jgi:hypothetical protein